MRWPTSKTPKLNPNIRTAKNAKTLPKLPLSVRIRKYATKLNIIAALVLITGAAGAWWLFRAGAAPDNCQDITGGRICDVDMVAGHTDTVLSMDSEATGLGAQGFGWYYGAVFRAPTSAINGAVPIYRVNNSGATYHDWMIEPQLRGKEARYGAQQGEGIPFYAWEHQVADTVPVYRLTRMGDHTQSYFTTDKANVDRLLAADANNPNGWKIDDAAPGIAFYAYPPNYTAAGQTNPYDCSIEANFLSERCKGQRENLEVKVNKGEVPTTNDCPKTVDAYLKAPFPGQFAQDCQNFWNAYMKDCSIQENFLSDRCKNQREELAREQERQAAARAAEAARQAKAAAAARKKTTSPSTPTQTPAASGLSAEEVAYLSALAAQRRRTAVSDHRSADHAAMANSGGGSQARKPGAPIYPGSASDQEMENAINIAHRAQAILDAKAIIEQAAEGQTGNKRE